MMARQIGSNSSSYPSGSAFVDDIIWHYLPSIGSRQFHLNTDENRPYALQALSDTIKAYSTDRLAAAKVWEEIGRGSPYDHIILLPNTEDAVKYHVGSPEVSLILKVGAVKPTVRQVFCNLILQDIRKDRRLRELDTQCYRINSESGTRRRRFAGKAEEKISHEDHQPLDRVLESLAEIKRKEDLEHAEQVALLAFDAMKNERHVNVVLALLNGDTCQEVSRHFNISGSTVRAINRKFMRLLLQVSDANTSEK